MRLRLMILATCTASAATAAAGAPAARQCLPMTDALQLEVERAGRLTEAAFAEALASQSLGILAPHLDQRLGQSPQGSWYCTTLDPTWNPALPCPATVPAADANGTFAPWQPYAYESASGERWFTGSNIYAGQAPGVSALDAAVFNAAGNVYRLVPRPRVLSHKDYFVCGCGPVGGGAPPPYVVEQNLYALPRADAFQGDLPLAFDATEVSLTFNNLLPNGEVCPQPP